MDLLLKEYTTTDGSLALGPSSRAKIMPIQFETGPLSFDVGSTSARVAFSFTEDGEYFVTHLPAADPAPTDQEMLALTPSEHVAGDMYAYDMSSLTPESNYVAYVAANGPDESFIRGSVAFSTFSATVGSAAEIPVTPNNPARTSLVNRIAKFFMRCK